MDCVILVDYANILIEGQRRSARQKGIVSGSPIDKPPFDASWQLHFPGLMSVLAEGRAVRKAIVVGSRPPADDAHWDHAKRTGFDVRISGPFTCWREKGVDTELAVQGALLIATTPAPATLVMASGDRDFIPLLRLARNSGWTAEVAAFSTSLPASGDMAAAVDRIRPLDDEIERIGWCEHSWP